MQNSVFIGLRQSLPLIKPAVQQIRGCIRTMAQSLYWFSANNLDGQEMNDLIDKYSQKGLAILGFPCNQFGHQENCNNNEILNSLKYVRPGNGFVPKIEMFSKVQVNGDNVHPLFSYLKEKLPFPSDDQEFLMKDCTSVIWSPVRRTDISWNFEKFLIDADGQPFKRYSRNFHTKAIAADIEKLLAKK